MMALCSGYREVYNYYAKIAKLETSELLPNSTILKTDLFNESGLGESFTTPLIPLMIQKNNTVYGVEVDSHVFNKVKPSNNTVLINQSILDVDFKAKFFDIIFDFSTIDHIKDYSLVLSRYNSWLKDYGKINLIVWTTTKPTFVLSRENPYFNQYFFNVKEFEEAIINNDFQIAAKVDLLNINEGTLKHYIISKKK